MEWIWKLMYLNIVWILFSLPIITIIPATFAMFSIVGKWFQDEVEPPIYSTFTSEFKSFFSKSYPLGIALIVLGAFFAIDLMILKDQFTTVLLTLRYALIFMTLFYLIAACYSIPVYLKYRFSWYKTLFIALMLGVRQPVITLLMLCGLLLVVLLLLFGTGIGILLMGSLIAVIFTLSARRGIQKI